jgi:hypothetical protein
MTRKAFYFQKADFIAAFTHRQIEVPPAATEGSPRCFPHDPDAVRWAPLDVTRAHAP